MVAATSGIAVDANHHCLMYESVGASEYNLCGAHRNPLWKVVTASSEFNQSSSNSPDSFSPFQGIESIGVRLRQV
jgi:hypothetical protein